MTDTQQGLAVNGREASVDFNDGATEVAQRRIAVRSLTRRFDDGKSAVDALGPVDLEVADGEFLSIVGPSGCGKSTMLRILAGLISPSAGEVAISPSQPGRSLMAMVFQDHSIYPWKTVEANVRLGLDLNKRVPRRDRPAVVAQYLDKLGLRKFAKAYPATLSGGMRQRVAIARALAVEPEILLMDEPFVSLDAQLRTILQDELVDLWENDRCTVVFITHSIEEAIFLSDRVLVMSARPGRICSEHIIPFGRPRSHDVRGDAEFAALHQEIWEILRSEVDHGLAEQLD